MTGGDNMLKKKQIELISNILQSSTLAEAIEKTGVPASTAYRWHSSDKEFIAELNRVKQEALDSVTVYLQASLARCSDELMDIVKDKEISPQIRINAIGMIFQNAKSLTEHTEVLRRLTELELKHEEERNR